jgi:hypothetical protein
MEILHFDAQYNLLKRDSAQSNGKIRKIFRSLRGKEIHVGYEVLIEGLLYDTSIAGHFRICAHQNAILIMWGITSSGGKYHKRMAFSQINDIAIFKKRKG